MHLKPNTSSNKIVRAVICLLFFTVISAAAWMTPIAFDDAFNFQVSQSLAGKFSYQSKYIPTKIYNGVITTNGPVQYLMAGMIKIFGLDVGRSLTLGAIGAVMVSSVYSYSIRGFIGYCLLIICWPLLAYLNASFLGEILAAAMMISGINHLEQWQEELANLDASGCKLTSKNIWLKIQLWISGVALGLAVSTKLIALAFSVLVVICLSAAKIQKRKLKKSALLIYVMPVLFIAVLFFLLQFSISILHSGGNIYSIWNSMLSFVNDHIHQAGIARIKYGIDCLYIQPYEVQILLVVAVSAIVMCCNSVYYLPLIISLLIMMIFFHLNFLKVNPRLCRGTTKV